MKWKLLVISLLSVVFLNAETLRVEVKDLAKDLSSYKPIDVRSEELYKESHIKGAVHFPVMLTYENQSVNGKIASPNIMQETLRARGLDIDDKIVIYDDGTFFDAARLFWALEVYGFKNVSLLNAGFEEWDVLDFPVSTEIPEIKRSNYIASIDNTRLATKFGTQIASRSTAQTVIDARGIEAYEGRKSSAERYGHIPTATHIPATHNIASDSSTPRLKSFEELKDVYKDIDKDKKVVVYCAIGKVSSTNYFTMRELGFNVANYDASWREWGNDFNLPIVNPQEN